MKLDISNKKTVIFDFDGVIILSEPFKNEVYMKTFSDFPEHAQKIENYIKEGIGNNRFYKFKHVYENILGKTYDETAQKALAERFEKLLLEGYFDLPLVPGVEKFIRSLNLPLFITTTALENEVKQALIRKRLDKYFKRIYGHPTPKSEAISDILETVGAKPAEALFFGDSPVDFEAARITGVDFVAISKDSSQTPDGFKSITDFKDISV